MTRSDFIQGVMPKLVNHICFDEQSPFKSVYKGELKNCGVDMLQIYEKSCEQYVPKEFVIDSQLRRVSSMTIRCLSAYYLGGEQQTSFINGEPVNKETFLTRSKPSLINYLCHPNGVFRKNLFKEGQEECLNYTDKQFDTCAYDLDYVQIPDILKNKQQVGKYGSIMGGCISAHYVGGDLLNAFKLLQERENQK